MAPRAVGLGASQITFVVVTALATTVGLGAVTAFTIAFTLLQIPIGVIGVPLGVVLFPSLSRGSRDRRSRGVRRPAEPGVAAVGRGHDPGRCARRHPSGRDRCGPVPQL